MTSKSSRSGARTNENSNRNHVFAYITKEDTPRPLMFQLDMLRSAGFSAVEILHKNVCFAAFGGLKGSVIARP